MAGLTSREGEAIKKALALDTGVDLLHKIDYLEKQIKQEEGFTRYRAIEASRILEPKVTESGIKEFAKGPLFQNLVKGLDESGLISALTAVQSVKTELEAKKAQWLKDANVREDQAGFLPGKKYNRKVLDALTVSS